MSEVADAPRGRRGGAEAEALRERLAFERLLADVLARVANAAPEDMLAELRHALGELVALFGYDRCTYSEFADDGRLVVIASASRGGFAPLPDGPLDPALSWLLAELRAGRVVALGRLPDDLPPEACAEARASRLLGVRSHLSIPLRAHGAVAAVLSFAGLRAGRDWPAELITRLSIVGEVMVGAIARSRGEQEVQRLRRQLWHADRVARTGLLTAAIAHEINQPLAAILSNAQAGLNYLDAGALPPEEARAILEAIVRDDKRAAQTIRSIWSLLRREESGRARIDVAAVLEEIVALLRPDFRRHAVHLELDLQPGCWAQADRVQVGQVALNLLLNATHALSECPPGERRLKLSAAARADAIEVAVSDSGPGIDAEHLEAVFEPFWTSGEGGLGLGLPICRSIVEAHGGTIRAERNADRGVTFRFTLPADTAGAAAALSAPTEAPRAEQPCVCVVDDDAGVRAAFARLLDAAGWRVRAFASAAELLASDALDRAACLVLDVHLPELSGLELQRQLAARPRTPPIVFVTGDGDVTEAVQAMRQGAVAFLEKPIEEDALLGAVRDAIACGADARARVHERDDARDRVARLSAREREVAAHLIRGRLNKQIAGDLGISEQTVKQHRGRVMEKLAVRSVAELVRVCDASQLFPADGVERRTDAPLAIPTK